jgi:hypothetical protein
MPVADVQQLQDSWSSRRPVIGRTPYDALAELFGLLGRALPWVTVLALFLYTVIEIGKSYQAAQAAATKEFSDRVTELNKLLQSNFSSLETLRNAQLEGLSNFSKVNMSVMEAISKNQAALAASRDELAKERESQEAAATEVRKARLQLQEAQRQQRALESQRGDLERKVWAAESIIDAASRLTRFIAERRPNLPVQLDRRALSLRFENSSPDAISRDSDGILYYGQYRLPGNQMNEFLKHLPSVFPRFAERLEAAGGANAAKNGDDDFKYEWVSLSRNREFTAAQDTFIEITKVDPFVMRIKTQLQSANSGFNPDNRSVALQAVLWSVALQHGQSTNLVVRAFDGLDISSAGDEDLIRAIYRERRHTERYFPSLDSASKTLQTARYVFEEELALKMLNQEREQK